jgi:hypothetical protein
MGASRPSGRRAARRAPITGSSPDTFLRFVDSLATHLDDHRAGGAELAARVHLSRFHFDRVISAVARESPARLGQVERVVEVADARLAGNSSGNLQPIAG